MWLEQGRRGICRNGRKWTATDGDAGFINVVQEGGRAFLPIRSAPSSTGKLQHRCTNTSDSDIDVFIDTHGLRVSRQEKERIVEVLRTADGFHQSHVKLKKLAIGCVVSNMEVDLVFSDTEEYGQLPGNFVQRFESNKAVQNAARKLKTSFTRSSATSLPSEKVPSFVLETLVLEAQEYRAKMMLSDVLSDGSMELFCDALQFLVDSPEILNSAQAKLFALASGEPCGLRGSKLSQGKLHSAQRHALDLLHLLCASRFYSLGQKGFTNLFDIERWIRKYSGAELNTPLGPVPSWIMGRINNEEEARNPLNIRRNSSGQFSECPHAEGVRKIGRWKPCINCVLRWADGAVNLDGSFH